MADDEGPSTYADVKYKEDEEDKKKAEKEAKTQPAAPTAPTPATPPKPAAPTPAKPAAKPATAGLSEEERKKKEELEFKKLEREQKQAEMEQKKKEYEAAGWKEKRELRKGMSKEQRKEMGIKTGGEKAKAKLGGAFKALGSKIKNRAKDWVQPQAPQMKGGTNWMGFAIIFFLIVFTTITILAGSAGLLGAVPVIGPMLNTVFSTNPLLNRFVSQYEFETSEINKEQESVWWAIFGPIVNPQEYLMEQESKWQTASGVSGTSTLTPPNIAFEISDFKLVPEDMLIITDGGYSTTSAVFKIKNTGTSKIKNVELIMNVTPSMKQPVQGQLIEYSLECGSGWGCCAASDQLCVINPTGATKCSDGQTAYHAFGGGLEVGVADTMYCETIKFDYGIDTNTIAKVKGSAQKVDLIARIDYSSRAFMPVEFIDKEYARILIQSDGLNFKSPVAYVSRGAAKIYMSTEENPILTSAETQFHLKTGIVNAGVGELTEVKSYVLTIPYRFVFNEQGVISDTDLQNTDKWNEVKCGWYDSNSNNINELLDLNENGKIDDSEMDNVFEICSACGGDINADGFPQEGTVVCYGNKLCGGSISADVRQALCFMQSGASLYSNEKYVSYSWKYAEMRPTEVVCQKDECPVANIKLHAPVLGESKRSSGIIRGDVYYKYMQSQSARAFVGLV